MLADERFDDDDASLELPPWSTITRGYHERFTRPFGFQTPRASLVIKQAVTASPGHSEEAKASADGLATGATVWDAGVVLAEWIGSRPPPLAARAGGTVLDLGSGTGVVGLAAAASGAYRRVVLTDLLSVVPLLEANAHANSDALRADVHVLPLRWGCADDEERVRALGPYDVVVGGDLLYRPQVVQPLLAALSAVCSPQTVIVLAASMLHSPETLRLFSSSARARGFDGELYGDGSALDCYPSKEVKILVLHKRGLGASLTSGIAERAAAPPSGRRRQGGSWYRLTLE